MKAYHFLRADFTAGMGDEKPWEVGEQRTISDPTRRISLSKCGYHSSPTLWAALEYAPGPMACLVEISEPVQRDDTKSVSVTRKLLKAVNIDRELRLFACDCAERVLRIYEQVHPADTRPRRAIDTARRFANGHATHDELDAAAWDAARAAARAAAWAAAWDAARAAARDAAWDAARAAARDAARDAAWDAAWAAAWDAARAAARDAARDAARAAAWAAEIKWQREHFDQIFGSTFDA